MRVIGDSCGGREGKEGEPAWSRCLGGGRGEKGGLGSEQRWGGFGPGAEARAASRDLASTEHGGRSQLRAE